MSEPIIKTNLGQLRGGVAQNNYGDQYYYFKGIPFAQPPVGALRFKAPQPAEPWTGIKDATKEVNECPQDNTFIKVIGGLEDCLQLNVYTKQLGDGKQPLKPVMVWIHGGAFITGSASEVVFGPQYFMREDIVLVCTNYRLGILGFLSLEDSSLGVPGNAGLKDQVMALKWVRENIQAFGGDPNNVTIFGESAGAASVHLLMLSPMTKDLFHKAIASSGSALNTWVMAQNNNHKIADRLNLGTHDEKKLLDYLMKASVEEIVKVQETLEDMFVASQPRACGPVVEKPVDYEEAFLTKDPIDVIASGNYNKVPFVAGFTSMEGIFILMLAANQPGLLTDVDFEQMIPSFLKLKTGSAESLKVASKIKQFYFGEKEPSIEAQGNTFQMYSDIYFVRGVYSAIKNQLMTSTAPIYCYRFSVDTEYNWSKSMFHCKDPGASHGDDLCFMFKMSFIPEIAPGSVEEKTMKRLVSMWTNFARYSDPNPVKKDSLISVKWEPVKKDQFNVLDIDADLKMVVDPESKSMKFWDNIFQMTPAASKH